MTATGLDTLALGGISLVVDGKSVAAGETVAYRGVMLGGVPNFAFVMGYLNSSWTLKADLSCHYVCRLLIEMRARRARVAVPEPDPAMPVVEWFENFTSNYLARAAGKFPKQGRENPWRFHQNFLRDWVAMHMCSVQDKYVKFYS